MNCKKCRTPNPPSAKFCQECGLNFRSAELRESLSEGEGLLEDAITLTQARPDWAMSNDDRIPPHIRRRMEQAQEGLIGKRRFVTILFADVQGFTSLCEKRDPEQVTELMSTYLGRLGEIVFENEGYIDKFMGDCLMALFGAPIAHENDQELAVRCGLRMLNAIMELNRKFNEELSIRVGINAGMVVAGGMGNNLKMQFTVIGDAVNVAQRLQSAAQPNQIVVGKSVYQATKSFFIYEPLGLAQVKGKSESIEAYTVRGSQGAASEIKERGLREKQLRLIGRQPLIAVLRPYFKSLQADRAKSFVLVGDAGVGKSRLKLEVKSALVPQGVKWFETVCSPQRSQEFMGPVIDLLRGMQTELRRLNDSEDGTLVDQVLESLTSSEGLSIGGASGDFHAQKLQLFHLLKDLVERLTAKAKVVLFFDDLHNADESTREWMSFMASDARKFLIAGARRSGEGTSIKGLDEIVVPPLSAEDSLELARSYLEAQSLPEALAAWIQRACQGNSYFIEESLRCFINDGRLIKEGSDWKTSSSFDLSQLPQSIHALIHSKIDQLPAFDREVIETAAVIGRRFSYSTLERALSSRANLEASLQYLRKLELIFEVSVNAKDIEYIFNQSLTREAIYQSLVSKRLKVLHQKVGEALESEPHRLEEVARHYLASDSKVEQGLEYFLKLLPSRSAQAALEDLNRQESALRERLSPAWQLKLMIQRSDLLVELRAWDQIESLWTSVLGSTQPLKKAWAHYWLGLSALEGNEGPSAELHWAQAEALATDDSLKLKVRIMRGQAQIKKSQQLWAEARSIYKRAFDLIEGRSEFGPETAQLLSDLATVFVAEGDIATAEKSLERAQTLATLCQLKTLSGRLNYQRGLLAVQLGRPTDASLRFREAYQSSVQSGRFKLAIQCLIQNSYLLVKANKATEALKYLKRAKEMASMTGDAEGLAEIERATIHLTSSLRTEGSSSA